MSMLRRWRERIDGLAQAVVLNADRGHSMQQERFAFSAEIPAGRHGPVCRVDVQVLREPQRDGERLRVRAHLQTNLASVLRPALQRREDPSLVPLPPSGSRALAPMRRARRIAGQGLQLALNTRVAQRLAQPLLSHDLNTWVELQASTEPLDDGAHSLVPQSERLAALGIHASKRSGPVAESWASETPNGLAQLSLLQIEKRDLPPGLARRLGRQPFQLAAAIVNTIEKK